MLFVAAILTGSLAAVAAPAGAAVWRPFSATSPWNVPAALKGSISSSNPYGSQFTSYTSSLELSGVALASFVVLLTATEQGQHRPWRGKGVDSTPSEERFRAFLSPIELMSSASLDRLAPLTKCPA